MENKYSLGRDKFRMDGHKLMYHVERVSSWLRGNNIYPIYVEVGLYGGCNHRCLFCAFDYLNYEPQVLKERCFRDFVSLASKKGVKSILFSGEGEPLLNPKAVELTSFARKNSIDVALSTNAVFLDKEKSDKILKNLSWIRVSLNAGSARNYSFIHGAKASDFKKVLENLDTAVKIRNKNNFSCTIGVQFLLIPENLEDIPYLAKSLKRIGVDYLSIKPFSSHPLSKKKGLPAGFRYSKLLSLIEKTGGYSGKNFRVIFRLDSMLKLEEEKPYNKCLGLPFIAHIDAKGDVYPCNNFVGREEFCFGNICGSSFAKIWEGNRRKRIMRKIENSWDIRGCRRACRLDSINRYLWEFKNPGPHINFI
ncbi:MAG: radical SAM protein [Candidatus Omnitrophica bacterium]|nr:radical SAM protein [Candidatus Omnitrophota bacterium]MBD3269400.1 radical SAM protein [Candidatus Omnitrophota bacterium]